MQRISTSLIPEARTAGQSAIFIPRQYFRSFAPAVLAIIAAQSERDKGVIHGVVDTDDRITFDWRTVLLFRRCLRKVPSRCADRSGSNTWCRKSEWELAKGRRSDTSSIRLVLKSSNVSCLPRTMASKRFSKDKFIINDALLIANVIPWTALLTARFRVIVQYGWILHKWKACFWFSIRAIISREKNNRGRTIYH